MPKSWPLILANLAGLLPLLLLVGDLNNVDPVHDLTVHTGTTALVLLIASLVCTPLGWIGLKRWVALRKPFGLYGFGYVSLHLAIYAIVDYGLDLGLIWRELSEKPYVIAGFSAFLLLLPLAITSTKGWQRRLGKRWKPLHRLVYLAVPLGVLHFVWLVKADWREPAIYAAIVALLLVVRLPPLRRAIQGLSRPQPRATIEPMGE